MAMVPNHFTLNVAKYSDAKPPKGEERRALHWCRIELPDPFEDVALEKARFIQEKLGPDFKLSLTKVTCSGKDVAI